MLLLPLLLPLPTMMAPMPMPLMPMLVLMLVLVVVCVTTRNLASLPKSVTTESQAQNARRCFLQS